MFVTLGDEKKTPVFIGGRISQVGLVSRAFISNLILFCLFVCLFFFFRRLKLPLNFHNNLMIFKFLQQYFVNILNYFQKFSVKNQ